MLDRFQRQSDPIYLADLDRCQPESALSRTARRFAWRMLDFETDKAAGTLLFAGEETEAAEITYPLEVDGWHDVYIGLFNNAWRPYEAQRVFARLSRDAAFSLIYLPVPSERPWGVPTDDQKQGPRIQDVFWKTADLTGRTLAFRQPCQRAVPDEQAFGNISGKVWLAYVKLVPLTDEEVRELERDRSDPSNRRLFAYNDSWFDGDRGYRMPGGRSEETAIQAQLEPYRHTDFGRIYWDGAHGDICNYLTRIGRVWDHRGIRTEDPPRRYDRLAREAWDDYVELGIDPFRVAADFVHGLGMEFHACYRIGWRPFYWPPPFDEFNRGGLYDQRPELRCVGRDGQPSLGLSYAFPETRRYVLSLIREMTEYPIDGVAILYNRQPPFLEYEQPLVEGFREEFGVDPRRLPETDSRWLDYKSRILTGFMRDLKAELAEAAEMQGRSGFLPVTVWLFGSREENLLYGIDVERWVEEGLVDTLIPYTSARSLFSFQMAWEDPGEVTYWVRLAREGNCRLALNVMPRDLNAVQYRNKAGQLYSLGVEHLAFWDTAIAGGQASETLARLGHKEEIAAWIMAGRPEPQSTSSPLWKLGEWDLSYFPE